jgi:zinc/manganese transport system substrate-binding protein
MRWRSNIIRPVTGTLAPVWLLAGVLLASCSAGPAGPSAPGALQVIAAENAWGSIAAQLGGTHVSVTSIGTNPNADPHEYESNPADARAFATADYVILNGAGYDDWATRLLDANPNAGRRTFTIAQLLGVRQGDNPHAWYQPDWVERVADRITADYKSLDSADAVYFDQQRHAFRAALKPYQDRIAAIRDQFGGTPVGATESIFVYLAGALGVNLISPPRFMQAVSQGNDPPAQDVTTFNAQIKNREIKVLVYNEQTSTAVTTTLRQLAAQEKIPVVGISETLHPPGASFQQWQLAQLVTLQDALTAGTASR